MTRKIANGTLKRRIKGKTAVSDQRLGGRVAVETAMPKEASKRASANTIQKRRTVKTMAVDKKNSPAVATTSVKPQMEPPQEPVVLTTRQGGGLTWGGIVIWLVAASNWVQKFLGSRHSRKRLRVCETVSLGDKRFVAVIEVDGEQFLVGGASNSVVTLARLSRSPEFSEVLSQRWAQDPMQA